SWQANDPVVHYLNGDLNFTGTVKGYTSGGSQRGFPASLTNQLGLGEINDRYAPWGQAGAVAGNFDPNPYNMAFKDPLVVDSDAWNFPTNKVPSIGWLGRIHRGTPWQSVYLKSTNILAYNKGTVSGSITWNSWTGNGIAFDQPNTAPVEDRLMFDLFSSAFNDNASRGQLSVNVGTAPGSHSLAAWSALFSAIPLPATSTTNSYTFLPPAGPYDSTLPITQQPGLVQLVQGINQARANLTNHDGSVGVFQHKGDILATAQLSERSPFLDLSQTNYNNDVMYEWLPQQVLSLLKISSAPRYVVYCYGQALRPAANGVYLGTTSLGGQSLFGMVTNYQVVAESATRVVLRIDGAPTNTHAVVESFNLLPPD
ncbi:MAG TPA: hypothetical protein VN625_04245, partial [Desulfuromonadaceae bacterium]|nr:hypothetical protein [Desulfuromonadaceae bacterium]